LTTHRWCSSFVMAPADVGFGGMTASSLGQFPAGSPLLKLVDASWRRPYKKMNTARRPSVLPQKRLAIS
jgi:hypothetical protein